MKRSCYKQSIIYTLSACISLQMLAEQKEDDHFRNYAAQFLTISSDTLLNSNDNKVWLFVFMSPDCPLCQKYTLVLNELQTQFSKNNIMIIAVFNNTYTQKEINDFIIEYKLIVPFAVDTKWKFASQYKASVTPEAIIFNNKSEILYRGLIDNSLEKIGLKRTIANKHYLKEALFDWVKNQKISVKHTQPVGCYIEYE